MEVCESPSPEEGNPTGSGFARSAAFDPAFPAVFDAVEGQREVEEGEASRSGQVVSPEVAGIRRKRRVGSTCRGAGLGLFWNFSGIF